MNNLNEKFMLNRILQRTLALTGVLLLLVACNTEEVMSPEVEPLSAPKTQNSEFTEMLSLEKPQTHKTGFVFGRRGRVNKVDVVDKIIGEKIAFTLRSYGPVMPELLYEQITTATSGCPPNTCEDVQIATHRP